MKRRLARPSLAIDREARPDRPGSLCGSTVDPPISGEANSGIARVEERGRSSGATLAGLFSRQTRRLIGFSLTLSTLSRSSKPK